MLGILNTGGVMTSKKHVELHSVPLHYLMDAHNTQCLLSLNFNSEGEIDQLLGNVTGPKQQLTITLLTFGLLDIYVLIYSLPY